jgi:hypothetical protein
MGVLVSMKGQSEGQKHNLSLSLIIRGRDKN